MNKWIEKRQDDRIKDSARNDEGEQERKKRKRIKKREKEVKHIKWYAMKKKR